jgi:isopentenyldiphosphate isomerase
MHISFSFFMFNSVSQYDNASREKYFPERWTVEIFLQQEVQYPWALEENTLLECRDVNKIGTEHSRDLCIS